MHACRSTGGSKQTAELLAQKCLADQLLVRLGTTEGTAFYSLLMTGSQQTHSPHRNSPFPAAGLEAHAPLHRSSSNSWTDSFYRPEAARAAEGFTCPPG